MISRNSTIIYGTTSSALSSLLLLLSPAKKKKTALRGDLCPGWTRFYPTGVGAVAGWEARKAKRRPRSKLIASPPSCPKRTPTALTVAKRVHPSVSIYSRLSLSHVHSLLNRAEMRQRELGCDGLYRVFWGTQEYRIAHQTFARSPTY